ncbi:hypothetical protein AKJ16_DCAP18369 [Drosera capensis]
MCFRRHRQQPSKHRRSQSSLPLLEAIEHTGLSLPVSFKVTLPFTFSLSSAPCVTCGWLHPRVILMSRMLIIVGELSTFRMILLLFIWILDIFYILLDGHGP